MSFENYRIRKNNNLEIDWERYKSLNPDLAKAGIVDTQNVIKHWFEYGMNENRNYTDQNQDICCQWRDIYNYLRDNNYIHKANAFAVTACVKSPTHLNYLKQCITHIRRFYPNMYIYVINDNSSMDISSVNGPNIEIIPALYSRAGEQNPYLFILDPRCKHDKLIYIHDTVFIKRRIDQIISRQNEIDFMWYAVKNIDSEVFDAENNKILDNLYIYCCNGKISLRNFINILKAQNKFYYVKFGSMSVFTKRFMEKVLLISNLKEVAHLFHLRVNRCLFERTLSILYFYIYGGEYNMNMCLCGDIFNHPEPFANKNIDLKLSIPLVKVWQGR